jgi:hypothetical protein
MPSTLIRTCSICGLRFTNGPLLDLHIREDHVQRSRPAEPDHDGSGDAGTSQLPTGPPAAGQPRTTEEGIAATAPQQPPPGWLMTIRQRMARTIRDAKKLRGRL